VAPLPGGEEALLIDDWLDQRERCASTGHTIRVFASVETRFRTANSYI
jgi:hypothetical protein